MSSGRQIDGLFIYLSECCGGSVVSEPIGGGTICSICKGNCDGALMPVAGAALSNCTPLYDSNGKFIGFVNELPDDVRDQLVTAEPAAAPLSLLGQRGIGYRKTDGRVSAR